MFLEDHIPEIMNSCDALVTVSDQILNSIGSLNKLEYNKNGRKYKFIQNGFQRIKQEDKHLMINSNDLSMKLSIISSFNILSNIDNGRLIQEYPDFCLSIVGVARELELNQWTEDSNIIDYKTHSSDSSTNDLESEFPPDLVKESINFGLKINKDHLNMGFNLLMASKLNFFHTDHHLGTKIYGFYLIKFMVDYFGSESINDPDILVALKSFVHWGNIKCVLYKLQVPNVEISDDEFLKFKSFPDPLPELKQEVWKKYPSGTSKYSLMKKSLLTLANYEFASLIVYPSEMLDHAENINANADTSTDSANSGYDEDSRDIEEPESIEQVDKFNCEWLFKLCLDIESDPLKYHLRAQSKKLTSNYVNLNALSNKYSNQINSLLSFISVIVTVFNIDNIDFVMKNSKIPKFEQIVQNNQFNGNLIKQYQELANKINFYKTKDWSSDDILLRLGHGNSKNLDQVIHELNSKYHVRE